MRYNRQRPGPELAGSFLILEGLAVLHGINLRLILPAGTIWPGLHRVPDHLAELIQPSHTTLSSNAKCVPWPASPRDAEVCAVLLVAQLLRSGGTHDRLALLSRYVPLAEQNRSTTAHLIGIARESLAERVRRGNPSPLARAGD